MKSSVCAGTVVLGFPRSGTTLLSRLLGGHPELCCPPETNLLRAAARFLADDDSPLGYSAGVLSSLRFVDFEPDQVIALTREMVFGILDQIARRAGRTRWVEKSALDIFHVETIERLLGDECRFVWITRNPIDVILSVREYVAQVEIYYPELHEYIARFPAPAEAFAHAWADTQLRMHAFASRRGPSCLRVRYERLVADPESVLGEILGFMDLPGDPARMVAGLAETPKHVGYADWNAFASTGVHKASVGRGASQHPKLLARLADILNPALRLLGDEEVRVPVAAGAVDPVRELQFRMIAGRMRKDRDRG